MITITCSGLLSGLVVRLPDFKSRSRELGRNYGLAKAGIPAQVFYEKVAKGHRLEFQPISSVSIPTRCVAFNTVERLETKSSH